MIIISRLRDCQGTENGSASERPIDGWTMDELNTDASDAWHLCLTNVTISLRQDKPCAVQVGHKTDR
jgi:hypothetical protein